MNKKDITMIKKAISATEESPVRKIATCFIETTKNNEVKFQDSRSFERIDESEASQYGSFMRKGVTGIPGTTSIEVSFDSNPLQSLIDTELEDDDVIRNICETFQDNYSTDENYFLYFAIGEYDLPNSQHAYNFALVMVQPCKFSKPGIVFEYSENCLRDREKDRCLDAPLFSFLYPSLDEGEIDVSKSVIFGKNAKILTGLNELCEALFGVKIPLSAEQQKEGFMDILTSGYTGKIPYESLQDIYEEFSQIKLDAVASGNDVSFSSAELADIVLKNGGIEDEEKIEAVKKASEDYKGCVFSAENVAPKAVKIESGQTTIKVNLNEIGEIKKQLIDGREYYLIPASNVEIEDIAVN